MLDQMQPNGIYADISRPAALPGPGSPDSPVPQEVLQAANQEDSADNDLGQLLKKYHALQAPNELANEINQIVTQTKMSMRAAGIYRRARLNYNLFYARDDSAQWDENLLVSGSDGGSMYVSVNVLKNAVDHLISMVTSHRPAIDPVTLNSSTEANDNTAVAKALIDFRLHSQGDIDIINEGLKQCPILGTSFIHAFWDPFKGGLSKGQAGAAPRKGQGVSAQFLPDGTPITPLVFQGDLSIECLSLYDVFYDISAKSWEEANDCVVRVYRNRYDLMVRFPEKAHEIAAAPAKSTNQYDEYLPSPSFAATNVAQTSSQAAMIEVWIYYHKVRGAVPYGRMQMQLPNGPVLHSGVMPEWVPSGVGGSGFPLHRMCPDVMVGTTHGYSVTTSAGGLQEALNIGASAMLTNMAAFARKLLLAQKGMEVESSEIVGDLKFLEVDFGVNGTPPVVAVDLLGSQDPLLKMLGWFVGQIEQDTGANSIVRGDPQGVTAGVAINLYQAMALQFASPYEEARSNAIAWFATAMVRSYQAHPNVQREVKVIGASKVVTLQKFYGADLSGIDSWSVDPGNPATRTLAMRYNMAVALKQDGVPLDPDKLVHLMQTGDWNSTVEGPDSLENNIRSENEDLLNGVEVHVIPGDDPVKHARGHLPVLANQRVRRDPALLKNALAHYQEHLDQMSKGDIILKLAAGMIPMGPFPPPNEQPAHGDVPAPSRQAQPQQPGQGQSGQPGEKGHAPGSGSRNPRDGGGAQTPGVKPPAAPPVPGIPGVS